MAYSARSLNVWRYAGLQSTIAFRLLYVSTSVHRLANLAAQSFKLSFKLHGTLARLFEVDALGMYLDRAERTAQFVVQILQYIDFTAQICMCKLQIEKPGLEVRRGRRAHLLRCAVSFGETDGAAVWPEPMGAGIKVVCNHGVRQRRPE